MCEAQQERPRRCNPSDLLRNTNSAGVHSISSSTSSSSSSCCFFLGGNDGNARHLRIVDDFRELDRHETVVNDFSERENVGLELASGRRDNVVIGQFDHAFQLHVEDALALFRPEQFRHVQRDNVGLGGGDGNLVRKLVPPSVRPVQLVIVRIGYQVG
jgi:hypothetical protein